MTGDLLQENIRRDFKNDNPRRQQTVADVNLIRRHLEVLRNRISQGVGDITAIALKGEKSQP